EKNLKTLENQAKKAERYCRLKEQYKSLSVMLASFRIAGFSQSLARLEEQEEKQAAERTAVIAEIETMEAEVQKHKLDLLTKEKNRSAQQKAPNDSTAKIRAYESEKKIKNEQLRHLEDKQKRLSEELERDKGQLNHVLYNIKRLNEELLQENEKLEILKSGLNTQKEELDELRVQQQSSKAALDQFVKHNTELQNQLYKAEKDIAILNIQKEALLQE